MVQFVTNLNYAQCYDKGNVEILESNAIRKLLERMVFFHLSLNSMDRLVVDFGLILRTIDSMCSMSV